MPFLYSIHDALHGYQRWTHQGGMRSLANGGLVVESIEPTAPPWYAAAILGCIVLAGPLRYAKFIGFCWSLPMVVAGIFFINSTAWVLNAFWPESRMMAIGYRAPARKPGG